MVRVFQLTWLVVLVLMVGLAPYLPDTVGEGHKAASREFFVGFMLVLAVLVPWQCTGGAAWLIRRWPELLNIPHKEHWLAPERREATIAWVLNHLHGVALQCLLLFAGLYYAELQRAQPAWPQVPDVGWWVAALALGAWFVAWVGVQFRRFPAPPRDEATERHPRRPGAPR